MFSLDGSFRDIIKNSNQSSSYKSSKLSFSLVVLLYNVISFNQMEDQELFSQNSPEWSNKCNLGDSITRLLTCTLRVKRLAAYKLSDKALNVFPKSVYLADPFEIDSVKVTRQVDGKPGEYVVLVVLNGQEYRAEV